VTPELTPELIMVASDDLRGRNVVVTGGVGALGSAVVDALRASGATCHLPVRKAGTDATPGVLVTAGIDLADEGAVTRYFAGLPTLWASVQSGGRIRGRAAPESRRSSCCANSSTSTS
jgi:NAD(P)-dependent dehydrogenase (short-subunit alcohol dehydrogenase family)